MLISSSEDREHWRLVVAVKVTELPRLSCWTNVYFYIFPRQIFLVRVNRHEVLKKNRWFIRFLSDQVLIEATVCTQS